jgi:hypothetical protein
MPLTKPDGAPNRTAPRARTWVWADLDQSVAYLLWFDMLAWRWEAQDVDAKDPVRTRCHTNRRSRWEGDHEGSNEG